MTSASSEKVAQLVEHWRSRGVLLNPGATEQALQEVERHLGYSLPDQFRGFYSQIDGMQDRSSDDITFSLWPVSYIAAHDSDDRPALASGNRTVAFADFLIDSHRYYLILAGPSRGTVVIDSGTDYLEMASDFDTFLAACYENPGKLRMFDRLK